MTASDPTRHDPIVLQTKEEIDERRMELMVGYLLLAGVVLSQPSLLLGLVLDYIKHGTIRLALPHRGHGLLPVLGPRHPGARRPARLGSADLRQSRHRVPHFHAFHPRRGLGVLLCDRGAQISRHGLCFFVAAVLAYTASKFCTEPRCVPSHKTDGKGLSRRVRFGKAMLELDNPGWV
jgi:hypothetical protein